MFPLAYALAPYLSLIPSSSAAPDPASGVRVWLGIMFVLMIQVIGRTFALPATIILINNCAPDPSVLGTVHGLAQSVSSAARTVGPVVGGWGFGRGLEAGVVGAVWWALAGMAIVGYGVSWLVKEGGGEEIVREGLKNGGDRVEAFYEDGETKERSSASIEGAGSNRRQ